MSKSYKSICKKTEQIIEELAYNMQVVHGNGYGTWVIKSRYTDDNGDEVEIKKTTHNEENYTGIFDGKEYNFLCGYNSLDELDEIARQECMTTETLQKSIWQDSANEDNYEPRNQRDKRLAVELLNYYEN